MFCVFDVDLQNINDHSRVIDLGHELPQRFRSILTIAQLNMVECTDFIGTNGVLHIDRMNRTMGQMFVCGFFETKVSARTERIDQTGFFRFEIFDIAGLEVEKASRHAHQKTKRKTASNQWKS